MNDFELIGKIIIEERRLGWTMDNRRSYVKATYGVGNLQGLTTEQLEQHLDYLDRQP